MNNKITMTLLAGAALAVTSGQALSADVAPAASDWTGFYFGVGGGGSFNFSNTDAAGYGIIDMAPLGEPAAGLLNGITEGFDGAFDLTDGGTIFGRIDAECNPAVGLACTADIRSAATMGDGASLLNADLVEEINEILNDGQGGNAFDGDNDTGVAGAFATAEAGFDFQVGSNFVIGLNASFDMGQTEISNDAAGGTNAEFTIDGLDAVGDSDNVATLSTDLEFGNRWSVGGRAGFLMNENNLIFASGGFVSSEATLKASYSSTTEGDPALLDPAERLDLQTELNASSSDDDWMNGYYIGGGLESLMTENVSVRLEYRFADLGSIETSGSHRSEFLESDGTGDFARGVAEVGVAAEADPIVHSVRATINWRF